MIRSIIFDLDGVLFDGCNFHAETFLKAYNTIIESDKQIDRKYHDRHLNAMSSKYKLKVLGLNTDISQAIYELKQKITEETIGNYIKPDSKVHDICKRLLELGYKIYCVSNSVRSTVETCLNGMGVIQYFSGIISNEDTTEPKPSPKPYLTLYRTYNLEPKECLIIEDSETGIISAVQSGGVVLPVKNCDDVTLNRIINAISKYDT